MTGIFECENASQANIENPFSCSVSSGAWHAPVLCLWISSMTCMTLLRRWLVESNGDEQENTHCCTYNDGANATDQHESRFTWKGQTSREQSRAFDGKDYVTFIGISQKQRFLCSSSLWISSNDSSRRWLRLQIDFRVENLTFIVQSIKLRASRFLTAWKV